MRKCPSDDNVFLAGTNRLWRANNFFNSTAPSWAQNSPQTTLDTSGTIHSIAYVASDTGCNTYVYGNRGGRVYTTQNGGNT